MTFRVPLARPALGAEHLAAVGAVLESGALTMGPVVGALESTLARICDSASAVACSNGTAALHLAFTALGLSVGDEVVMPAYTFPATANAVVLCGGTPVFCDVDPLSGLAGAAEIEPRIGARTKAICVVPLYGQPLEMESIVELATVNGVALVEDAAGALGTLSGSAPAGSFGAAGCLSFHPRKIVTTGEGGAVLTSDPDLAGLLRALRHHGIGPNGFERIGFNYRLSDIQAAVALPQLARLEELVAARRRIAAGYDERLLALAGLGVIPAPAGRSAGRHSYQAYVARLVRPEVRDRVVAETRRRGIEVQIGTYCVPALDSYGGLGFDPARTPAARRIAGSDVALPLAVDLTDDELDDVVETLAGAIRDVGR